MSILKEREKILQTVVIDIDRNDFLEVSKSNKTVLRRKKSSKRKKKKKSNDIKKINPLFYRKMLKLMDYDDSSTLLYNIRTIIENNEEKETKIFLNNFIKSSENEIKIVARDNYETFISFGEQLNRLKSSAFQIKSSLSIISENQLQASSSFFKEYKSLDKYLIIDQNIEKTINLLHHFIFTFKQIEKLKSYIETNKSPLLIYKLMEKIENTYFKNVNHFRMIKKLQNIINMKKKSMGNIMLIN